tara:strand:+ start:7117 stop:7557 length:441 start_codon:yes stop_codon:yes gene_type:complete
MEVRPFLKEHGYVVFNQINNSLIGNQTDLSFINELEVGDCFTGVKDNKPIICGGVIKMWQGCYEGWVIATHHVNDYPIETARLIKNYVDELIKKNNMHRLQTAVLKGYTQGYRFAEFLGMKQEGIMEKYDYMQQDYIRYARIICQQ